MKRKSIIQGLSICAVLIFVILTSGCVTTRTYTGEALPKEQIAVIRGSVSQRVFRLFGKNIVGVKIVSVEGELVKKPSMAGSYQRVEVMPGKHKILVEICGEESSFSYWRNFSVPVFEYQELELNVEAGHEYKIVAKNWWKPDGFIAIVDTSSGETVLQNPLRTKF